MKFALGLVEAIGLGTAFEAADAALKSANILLLGLESTRGDGMHTLKILGEVGAVEAAVAAAEAACANGRGCFSATIIARPAEQIEPFVNNDVTIGSGLKKSQLPKVVLEDYYRYNPELKETQEDLTTEVEGEEENDTDQDN